MEAGQVKVLLGPCDEALQVRLVDGADRILAGACQSLSFASIWHSKVDVRYLRSIGRLVAAVKVSGPRQLG